MPRGVVNVAAMSSLTFRLLEAIPWRPGLVGDFAGQQSFLELGTPPARLVLCWCPPPPPGQPFIMGSPPDEPERGSSETQSKKDIPDRKAHV